MHLIYIFGIIVFTLPEYNGVVWFERKFESLNFSKSGMTTSRPYEVKSIRPTVALREFSATTDAKYGLAMLNGSQIFSVPRTKLT